MMLRQMTFHLAHRIEHHTNHDQQTRASKKLCHWKRYVPNMVEETRARRGIEKDYSLAKYTKKFFAACDKKYSDKR